MCKPPQTKPRIGWWRPLVGLACACITATAQDFALQVADPNPLGIGSFVPSRLDLAQDAGVEGGMKGAFAYGLGLEAAYDSNFFLSERDESSEFYLHFMPWLGYVSDPEGGAPWSLTANYRPVYRLFTNHDDLSDLDHAADFSLTALGSRTSITMFARYKDFSGTDRLSGSYTSGWIFTGGVQGTRQVAPRTSLNASLSYALSEYSGDENVGSEVFTGTFGGMWSASERLALGATILYAQTESDNTGTRDSWALLAEARYKASERIWLSASLGPEFSRDSESGDHSVGARASLRARYVINERWSWVSSLNTATVPSPSETGYLVNNVYFSTELEHQLLRAVIRGGVEINYSDYKSVGDTLVERENEENLALFLAYSRNLFSERVAFQTSVRYRVNQGATDWTQWLVTVGLGIQF
jgi:hypothetical protein